jgi:hypothetical protein
LFPYRKCILNFICRAKVKKVEVMKSKTYSPKRRTTPTTAHSEMAGIYTEIKNLNSKIDRILRTLIGDEEMAQEGLVTKVDRHEKFIQRQKLLMAKIMGIAIGSGLFGGFIGQVLIKFLIK